MAIRPPFQNIDILSQKEYNYLYEQGRIVSSEDALEHREHREPFPVFCEFISQGLRTVPKDKIINITLEKFATALICLRKPSDLYRKKLFGKD